MNEVISKVSQPRRMIAAAVLIVAVAAAYANALHGGFVWDDLNSIVQNRLIEHLSTALDRPAAVNTSSGRPLVALSLAFNHALGGLDPLGYHVFNVLVHAAAALVLFGFVRRLALLPRWGGRYESHATGLALGVAAVWALHPLQTEAVTYVIQRAESLMGLCYLLTLYLFLRSEGARRPGVWRTLAVAACALGMMAKEVMVSAPVMVLLFDRTFVAGSFRRAVASKRLFYGGLFGTWVILAWLVASLGGNRDASTAGFSTHAPWIAYWLTQFPAIATYLKLAFFPHPLIFQYGPFWLPDAAAALPTALVVVPLVSVTIVALVRWPEAGFFGFWFFSILAVTSLVPGISDMIAEHRMYLALAPLWILVAAGLFRWRPRLVSVVLGAAAVAFGILTVVRNRDYRSELILLSGNVARRPNNALTRYNLAVDLQGEPGRAAEAQAQLEAAVRLQPDFAAAHFNLGLLLSKQPGQEDRAIAQYEDAIRIDPRKARPHLNLAVLLHQRGQEVEACRQLGLGVECDPSNRTAWLDWVHALVATGRPDDAVAAGAALVRAHPDFADGQTELGLLLAGGPKPAEAVPHLEAALRLDPTQAAARFYLATVLVQLGERLPEAVALLEAAAREQPDSAQVRFNLGAAYLAAGNRVPDAIAQFTAAVRLEPRFADAHFNLATALEIAGGHEAAAIAHYRMAATLQPDDPVIHFRLARLLAIEPRSRAEARAELRKALALDPNFPDARQLLEQLGGAAR